MAPESSPPDMDDESIDVARYVRVLHRHWKSVLGAAAIGGAAAFAYVSLQPIVFEGVTTVLVVSRTLPSGLQMTPSTFSALVRNTTLASQVIDELKLQQEITPQRFVDRALNIDNVPGTSIVRIEVRLRDPRAAADASRRIAKKAVLLTQQVTQQEGGSSSEQLKAALSEAQDRVRKAEQELLAFEQHAQIDLLRQDTDVLLRERADLMQVLVDLETERARLAAAEAELRSAPVQPPNEERGRPAPRTQALETQIASSRTRIAALEQQRDQLANVRKVGGKELAQLNELYNRQLEQTRLEGTLDLARRLASDLALKYEQTRTQPMSDVAALQILDDAMPPTDPVSRRRFEYAAFGGGAGLVGAMIVALVGDSRRRSQP